VLGATERGQSVTNQVQKGFKTYLDNGDLQTQKKRGYCQKTGEIKRPTCLLLYMRIYEGSEAHLWKCNPSYVVEKRKARIYLVVSRYVISRNVRGLGSKNLGENEDERNIETRRNR
jgi:hypothetical protein